MAYSTILVQILMEFVWASHDAFRLHANAHQLSKLAILYFPIHSNFLSFAAGKNFDLSISLDRTQSYPVLVTRED